MKKHSMRSELTLRESIMLLGPILRRHEPDIFSLKLCGPSCSSGTALPSIGLADLG